MTITSDESESPKYFVKLTKHNKTKKYGPRHTISLDGKHLTIDSRLINYTEYDKITFIIPGFTQDKLDAILYRLRKEDKTELIKVIKEVTLLVTPKLDEVNNLFWVPCVTIIGSAQYTLQTFFNENFFIHFAGHTYYNKVPLLKL